MACFVNLKFDGCVGNLQSPFTRKYPGSGDWEQNRTDDTGIFSFTRAATEYS